MSDQPRQRARSLSEMGPLMGKLLGPQDIGAAVMSYRPRPSDIVISPFGKCGTTWLQQIFHTLRTRGDMDFDDISRVVPWIETARVLGIDLEAPQRAEPRGFKSHMSFYDMPKGARYVVSLRDPKDALVSMYRFMEGWFLEPGAVPIREFAQIWLKEGAEGPRSYWRHLISWWEQRDNPDVLLLTYEHMTDEPEAHVRKLAAFCGIALDDDLLALTLERSSLAYMLEHADRFDDFMMRAASEEHCGLPPGSDSAKVRKGGVGGHRQELPADIAAALDTLWSESVAPSVGFRDYASLEAEVRRSHAG